MEWQIPTKKAGKRPKDGSDDPACIDSLIRSARYRAVKESDGIDPLRDKIESLRDRLILREQNGRVSDFRRSRDMAKDIQKLQSTLTDLENGVHIKEFDDRVARFMVSYNSCEALKRRKGVTLLPGEKDKGLRCRETNSFQAEVVQEYMSEVENRVPKVCITRQDFCPICPDSPCMRMVPAQAIVVCLTCGYCACYLDATASAVSYGDDIEYSSFSYKRINHMNEWLLNIMGMETFEVPQHILTQVCDELWRQRVISPSDITFRRVREVLKTLRLRRYYEHSTQITCRITGRPPPVLSTQTQEMTRLMFRACQGPFLKICPKSRKNFLSYSYILYKFLELLGETEILEAFTLLKGRDKRAKMDDLFSKLCRELDWEFIPTV